MVINTPDNKEKLNEEYKECEKLHSKVDEDKDNDSGITTKAREEEEQLIKKLMGTDLDDIQKIGDPKKPVPAINFNDNLSVASSLTMNSKKSNLSIESTMSVDKLSKIMTTGTTNFEHLFPKEELKQLTQKEIVERINQWFQHKQNKSSNLTNVSRDSTPIQQNQKKMISGSASKPPPSDTSTDTNNSKMPASSSNTGNQE